MARMPSWSGADDHREQLSRHCITRHIEEGPEEAIALPPTLPLYQRDPVSSTAWRTGLRAVSHAPENTGRAKRPSESSLRPGGNETPQVAFEGRSTRLI